MKLALILLVETNNLNVFFWLFYRFLKLNFTRDYIKNKVTFKRPKSLLFLIQTIDDTIAINKFFNSKIRFWHFR